MTSITKIYVTPEALNKFPGIAVLATNFPLVGWEEAVKPDWSIIQEKWQGWSRSDLLAHPAIFPFCDLFKRMEPKPSRYLPSFANFILRSCTKPGTTPPSINPVVDHVNFVAVSTLCSFGVFDAAAVTGRLKIDLSMGGECFEPIGGNCIETIEAGKLILCDDEKVLSLFSVRDSQHQIIKSTTRDVILMACIVPGVDPEHAKQSIRLAVEQLQKMCTSGSKSGTKQQSGPWFGRHGGMFIPETMTPAIAKLIVDYPLIVNSETFQKRYKSILKSYVGRETPLTLTENFSHKIGIKTYLKREDLVHTGAHKINNTLGQALLAQFMGKRRIIAETGSGQQGESTAAVCSFLGLDCTIYMGKNDIDKQYLKVQSMRLMGANVLPVANGSQTIKGATNEALRDWVGNSDNAYYMMNSILGPHPYPTIVRDFQSVIGVEAKQQFAEAEEGALPDILVACVGGGSNAIGLFNPFLADMQVRMIGVEAAGFGATTGQNSIRLSSTNKIRPGVMQGCRSYVMQDIHGQISETYSIAPELSYPMVGPELSWLHDIERVKYLHASDEEALSALNLLACCEGIIPSLESAHGIAGAIKIAQTLPKSARMIINISGRGDKDMAVISQMIKYD